MDSPPSPFPDTFSSPSLSPQPSPKRTKLDSHAQPMLIDLTNSQSPQPSHKEHVLRNGVLDFEPTETVLSTSSVPELIDLTDDTPCGHPLLIDLTTDSSHLTHNDCMHQSKAGFNNAGTDRIYFNPSSQFSKLSEPSGELDMLIECLDTQRSVLKTKNSWHELPQAVETDLLLDIVKQKQLNRKFDRFDNVQNGTFEKTNSDNLTVFDGNNAN